VGDEQSRPTGQRGSPHWFGKKEGGLGFGPLTWQGRAVTSLYVVLVILAVFVYSEISLTILVVVFYTIGFCFIVMFKSDLLKHWPPGS
jgi:hypothetical protein